MSTYVRLVHLGQRFLLRASYSLHRRLGRSRKRGISWVIGVDEIAAMVHYISEGVPDSYSISFRPNKYYSFAYDFGFGLGSERIFNWKRTILGPILLGRLARRSSGFLYVGASGFLVEAYDHRRYEFDFLTRRGIKVVCFFTGNDIRSPKLMLELQQRTGIENIATHLSTLNPVFGTAEYDSVKREIAAVADKYASAIFNAAQDQLSYLKGRTEPFIYFYPDENFVESTKKFDDLSVPVIVHAPSNPLLKGTDRVRAAIGRLQDEGYPFEYVELVGVSNEAVLNELRRAQIVLNEFYAFVPGIFGVEAMASMCALMTSADEFVETDLPAGSNRAWRVTRYDAIYENLKDLLDHPESLLPLALSGYRWATENAARSKSSARIRRILHAVQEGTYGQ